jgi:predicted O-methyltransferase YrrM
MTNRSLGLSDALHAYLVEETLREPALLARLRAETAAIGERARMQIAPEQGQFMALLLRLIGARQVLEVGTFTGYSALAMALALPEGGRVLTCDLSEEWTVIARRYWAEAGMENRIELVLGPAAETLARLRREGADEAFDAAFIDADKENYPLYYEECLALVRPGGLIMVDNALWSGAVADPSRDDAATQALRRLNRLARDDDRVDASLAPVGDGLLLVRKR